MARRPCSVCGTPKIITAKSLKDIICQPCRRARREARPKPQRPPRSSTRRCELCEVEFYRHGSGKDSMRFCSRGCATVARAKPQAWEWRVLIDWTHCEECAGPMIVRPRRRHCSKACSYAAQKRAARKKYNNTTRVQQRKTHVIECRCGSVFESGSSAAKYCSNRCRRRAHGKTHRDRAAKYGCDYEPFNVIDIYVRDAWTCGICGDPISQTKAWPDLMCASLDHVVPLSKGGAHRPDNVRASHWLCNSYRGADEVDFLVDPRGALATSLGPAA